MKTFILRMDKNSGKKLKQEDSIWGISRWKILNIVRNQKKVRYYHTPIIINGQDRERDRGRSGL